MDHQKVYDKIIEKAKSENRKKVRKDKEGYVYYEKHHILPKCLGGTNDKENLVLLTGREHFIVHKLLACIHKGNRNLVYAMHRLAYDKKTDRKLSSRDYQFIKELKDSFPFIHFYDIWIEKFGIEKANELKVKYILKLKKPKSEQHKEHLRGKNVGKKHAKEQNEEHSKRMSGENNPNFGKPMSKETANKIRIANTGKKRTPEMNERNRQIHLGKKQSEETKQKRNEKLKGKKRTEETKQKMRKSKSEQHKLNIKKNHYKNKNKNKNL